LPNLYNCASDTKLQIYKIFDVRSYELIVKNRK